MSFAIYQLIVFLILISFDVGTAIYQRYIEKKETHVSVLQFLNNFQMADNESLFYSGLETRNFNLKFL